MRDYSDQNTELLRLHERLLANDPVASLDTFQIVTPILERYLRYQFVSMGPSVDPDIYLSAIHDALTDYFKKPQKYDPNRSGLLTYLKLAAKRDLQNLLRKESRHAKNRISFEDVGFSRSSGNNVSEEAINKIEGERLATEAMQGMTNTERAVFCLMIDGDSSTESAADAVGIGHLSQREKAREIKKIKDRIKKRIQRRGITNE